MDSVSHYMPVLLRPPRKEDVPFITNSWLESFRSAYMVKGVPNRTYYYQHHRLLENLIPRSMILVACAEDQPDQIMGWICAEVVDTALIIHYVYVKEIYRGWGLAKMLVETLLEKENPFMVQYSHITQKGWKILNKKYKEAKAEGKDFSWFHNPYMMFSRLPSDWNWISGRAQG